ncbi:MAG TPA: hypothetical protein VFV99_26955 [Kofleriaceae bacterium]|nr:hypothetical protein [Kofleriaceae bacterium]
MKHALVLAIVLAASSASAQPAARGSCEVTFVRVPETVRPIVERWVQAEPKCNTKLEIRIVPTAGGLYLLARDPSGRIRERVVPDAQSAGVLVASWIAADSLSPYEVRKPPTPEVAPVPPEAMLGSDGQLLAPGEGAAPGAAGPVITHAVAAEKAPGKPRWLSLGPLIGLTGPGGGLRGEWDAKMYGSWVFGAAASTSRVGMAYLDGYGYDTIDMFDTKALAYAGLVGEGGHWHMRGTAGVGVVYTRAHLDMTASGPQSAEGVFPTAELQLMVGRDFGDHWAIDIGPILSIYAQEMQLESSGAGYYSYMTANRDVAMTMFGALRYRL